MKYTRSMSFLEPGVSKKSDFFKRYLPNLTNPNSFTLPFAPKGSYLFGDPDKGLELLQESIEKLKIPENIGELKKQIISFTKDETAKISFDNIFDLDVSRFSELNFQSLVKVFSIAISILAFANSDTAFAADPKNEKQIEWALEVTDKVIDPLHYLSNRNNPNKAADTNTFLTDEDRKLLTLNLYHEGRGESFHGQLGIILSVLERMKSAKHPDTVSGVVFKAYQYSWANNLEELFKKEKITLTEYTKLRSLIEKFTSGSISDSLNAIKTLLEFELKRPIPDGLTNYHKFGMLAMEKYKNTFSKNTADRISKIENLFESSMRHHPDMILLGTHLFYIDNPRSISEIPKQIN